jgi:hypothetical protein
VVIAPLIAALQDGFMAEDKLEDRRKALEEAFFRKRERELIEKLRAEEEAKGRKRALADVSGIRDEALLDRIVAAGVHTDVLAAFSLAPLIAVAWADHQIDEKERKAVLEAAEQMGVTQGSAAHALLESWLTHRPGPELIDAWAAFVQVPRPNLPEADRERLKRDTLDRAKRIAAAAGGFLGVGSVGPSEREVLARIERAFG